MVIQSSLHGSPRRALSVSAGIAIGAGILALIASSGFLSIGRNEIWQSLAQVGFTVTLGTIGARALLRSVSASSVPLLSKPGRASRSFLLALVTAITNPLTAVFFATSTLELGLTDLETRPVLVALAVFFIALSWFGLLSLMFLFGPIQKLFSRVRRPVEATLGIYLILLAFRI
jgi:threonine/homoserine/homoserine lactone efflux protein